jgi:hypothetical protein
MPSGQETDSLSLKQATLRLTAIWQAREEVSECSAWRCYVFVYSYIRVWWRRCPMLH